MTDVIIIGAGAAGIFAAGSAIKNGLSVIVLERNSKPGLKLLITGKGRCNVINNCDEQEFLRNVRRNSRFLYSAVRACPPQYIMSIFEDELNISLKTERGRRVFPVSDKAEDILNGLLLRAQGAKFMYNSCVKSLIINDGMVKGVNLQNGEKIFAKNVIIACGGVSYPTTGSTGDGYKLAKMANHTIIEPQPSLVSLVEQGATCKKMTGLSLRNVSLSLWENNKQIYTQQGELLFTHFGLSGPLVLSASAHINDMKKYNYTVTIDTKPALTQEVLAKRIDEDFTLLSKKEASKSLTKLLPASMQQVVIDIWNIDTQKQINQITRKERQELVKLLKAFPVKIKSKGDLDHAVITSGGVCVKEIDPKTMQSKLCKGLYFAGEVIDVDAYTGGYNLGIAFATAHAATLYM